MPPAVEVWCLNQGSPPLPVSTQKRHQGLHLIQQCPTSERESKEAGKDGQKRESILRITFFFPTVLEVGGWNQPMMTDWKAMLIG